MNTDQNHCRGLAHMLAICALAVGVAGCSGDNGTPGAAGAPGPGVASKSAATALSITVTGVSINSAPVVNFKVTNQDSSPVTGLDLNDLRFTIAKLTPGSNGAPSAWQNYINTASGGNLGAGYVRGNREGGTTGTLIGTLVDHQNGTYTYTFKTDITDPAQTCPAAPCIDADGNTLNTSYNASLTHRVAIQTRGTLPMANGVYTFRPSDGATTGLFTRDVVATAKCNECHNKLVAHDARIDTQYCVMCHNPGSTAKGQVGTVVGPTPVDFKVLIHKLHHGDELPSVLGPDGTLNTADDGDFGIFGFSGTLESFKDVAFPQDIRNCTKCHDGTVGASNATAQGDNWKNQPSKAACSSCHDDLYFGASADPAKPYQTVSHITVSTAGGAAAPADPDDSMCTQCHGAGQIADVAVKHTIPSKVVRGNFKFNIVEICGTAIASNPACAPATTPTVKFSVTDPTGATTHGYGNKYNIFADPEFFNVTPKASLTVDIAWDTRDYTNTDGSQARPGRANQFNVYGTTAVTNAYGNVAIPAYPAATDNGDGTFTLTAATPIPASATGSGVVALEGRAFNPLSGLTSTEARVPVKGEVAYFSITDVTPKARRVVADATGKCDKCHDQLALHGGNRNDNVQLCVLCHNPSNTDAQASARPKAANHLPIGTVGTTADSKKEESVDFKRMIHGIHAGAKTSLDGTTTLYGFREKGIWIAGGDFSGMRFPGILNDCSTCHSGTSYQLTGIWETPTQTGNILGSTIDSVPASTGITTGSTSAAVDAELNNPANDLKISPIAAVCSSCHDGDLPKQHMELNGAIFGDTQANIAAGYETCAVCHGPGRTADVKVVHSVP